VERYGYIADALNTGFGKTARFKHNVAVQEWFRFRFEDGRQTEANHITWLVMIDSRPRVGATAPPVLVEGCYVTGFSSRVTYKEGMCWIVCYES
jgi:hypothetical protein